MEPRYFDISSEPRPTPGLPAAYVFRPLGDDQRCVEMIASAQRWCRYNLGRGTGLSHLFGPDTLDDDTAWGWWPSGVIFIREEHYAIWFKMMWC